MIDRVLPVSPYRWFPVTVFILSSTLNYLDRSLLAVLAPLIMAEFHFNQTGYGLLISVFSIVYAASSLGAGWFLDRMGVDRGMSAAVAWWSFAAVSTGLVRSYPGLGVCRGALAIGESAGIPAVGKVNGLYLLPEERAFGAAANQIGISAGAMLAPLFIGIATVSSWRTPFMICGAAGFAWIGIWLAVSRRFSPISTRLTGGKRGANFRLLANSQLLTLVAANALWMPSYSLWTNWTSLYLIHTQNISLQESARYVWIPPLISNVGGFFGAWASFAWMKRTVEPVTARRRGVFVSVAGLLLTLTLPLMPNAAWTTGMISVSFFFALAGSVNIYALPIDLFGPERAGLAIAALGFAYGIMQMLLSPVVGYLGDHRMYSGIIWLVTLPPILGASLLLRLRAADAQA